MNDQRVENKPKPTVTLTKEEIARLKPIGTYTRSKEGSIRFQNSVAMGEAEQTDINRKIIYHYQRESSPSFPVLAAAWESFGTTDVKLANPDNPDQKQLIDRVIDICAIKKIPNIPAIYVVDHPSLNAFSMNGEAVVYSTGILNAMTPKELDAVTGHELSHHRHRMRDNVSRIGLGMGAGFLGEIVASTALSYVPRAHGMMGMVHDNARLLAMHGSAVFAGALAVGQYTHFMEYEADKEGALATSPAQMKSALRTLEKHHEKHIADDAPTNIVRSITRFFLSPFTSHPSTQNRLAALDRLERKLPKDSAQIG